MESGKNPRSITAQRIFAAGEFVILAQMQLKTTMHAAALHAHKIYQLKEFSPKSRTKSSIAIAIPD